MVVYFAVAKHEVLDILMRTKVYKKTHWIFKLKFVYGSSSLNGVAFVRCTIWLNYIHIEFGFPAGKWATTHATLFLFLFFCNLGYLFIWAKIEIYIVSLPFSALGDLLFDRGLSLSLSSAYYL